MITVYPDKLWTAVESEYSAMVLLIVVPDVLCGLLPPFQHGFRTSRLLPISLSHTSSYTVLLCTKMWSFVR
jgi:hypothetical protein